MNPLQSFYPALDPALYLVSKVSLDTPSLPFISYARDVRNGQPYWVNLVLDSVSSGLQLDLIFVAETTQDMQHISNSR